MRSFFDAFYEKVSAFKIFPVPFLFYGANTLSLPMKCFFKASSPVSSFPSHLRQFSAGYDIHQKKSDKYVYVDGQQLNPSSAYRAWRDRLKLGTEETFFDVGGRNHILRLFESLSVKYTFLNTLFDFDFEDPNFPSETFFTEGLLTKFVQRFDPPLNFEGLETLISLRVVPKGDLSSTFDFEVFAQELLSSYQTLQVSNIK